MLAAAAVRLLVSAAVLFLALSATGCVGGVTAAAAAAAGAKKKKGGGGSVSGQFPRKLDRALYCGVCKAAVDEAEAEIAATAETHTVQVRFRIDEKKRIPYARSEYRVIEVLENDVAGAFKDYAVGSSTSPNGKKQLHLVRFNGASKTGTLGNVEISTKRSAQMKAIYEWMMEEHLEAMTKVFHERAFDDPPAAPYDHSALYTKLCVDALKACGKAHTALTKPSPYADADADADAYTDAAADKTAAQAAAEKRPPEHADL